MKHDKDQMTFGDEFARQLAPAGEVSEPLVWFQSLHLIRQLGAGDGEPNLIRKFTFRRGLNILWAEPEAPEDSARLYGDGFAGHSTGKTLFCRILRYLLGEMNYGTTELQKHVRESFSSLWAVASIRLDGETWLVGRALAGDREDFAVPALSIDDVLRKAPGLEGYATFTDKLESTCGAPLSQMYPTEAWRNLLPWLARDQEARLSTITSWRDSSSEADNPQNSAGSRHLILRSVLRLLDPKEYDSRQQIVTLEENIRTWSSELPLKQAAASQDLVKLKRTLKSVQNLSIDLTDLQDARGQIAIQRRLREQALEDLPNQPESGPVQQARNELQIVLGRKIEADSRIKVLKVEIPAERVRADRNLINVERIKKGGFTDPSRVEDNFCPNSYLTACKRECVPLSPDDIDPSMIEIGKLEADAKEAIDAVEAKEKEKAQIESQQEHLEAEIETKREALKQALRANPNITSIIQASITRLTAAEDEVQDAIKSAADEARLTSKMENAQREITGHRNKLAGLRDLAALNLRRYSEIFGDLAQAILGQSITAFADLGERSINLHIKRNDRELGGAAIESIKTLAFDLAAVVHSIEGNCHHPRFLIHDGPREADMARVTYEHFFLWALKMESAFQENQASFQYIITTTTHPPENMREGSKWLLGEKLSGKSKSGRLLKEDF